MTVNARPIASGAVLLAGLVLAALAPSATANPDRAQVSYSFGSGSATISVNVGVRNVRPIDCALIVDRAAPRTDAFYGTYTSSFSTYSFCRFDFVSAASMVEFAATIVADATSADPAKQGSFSVTCRRVADQVCSGQKGVLLK